MVESRNAYRVLVGRPEGKIPLERPRRKMDLREVGYDGRDWINLAQDKDQWWAYVRAAMKLGSLKARLLWPTKEYEERLLAFLTDSAAYMLKAAGALQVFYPKIIHIICIVHDLHRAAEDIRSQHPKANNLISSVKKVFVKASARTALFRRRTTRNSPSIRACIN
ncbi:hypothetical protein ANN_18698 [Periplaneta americana]|uniref:Uncharacterized protein n=1 Tax=Periplaneta americana TaxID=6978 RepID=A0ABQ8SQP6_PERAM|nr:hypothetical protein ANN_18698 [Periplaneta americana]